MLGRDGTNVEASLDSELVRATSADSVDVSASALLAIARASHDADDRRRIMRHLHGCLTESASAQWRRVYSGMVVVEYILMHGSSDLVSETAYGLHFDLVQRLSFLEKYEYNYDQRVEGLLRSKARFLRNAWLEQQLALEQIDELCNMPVTSANKGNNAIEESNVNEPTKRCDMINSQDGSTTDGESSESLPDGSPTVTTASLTTVQLPQINLLDLEDPPVCVTAPSVEGLSVTPCTEDWLFTTETSVPVTDLLGTSKDEMSTGTTQAEQKTISLVVNGSNDYPAVAPIPHVDMNLLDF